MNTRITKLTRTCLMICACALGAAQTTQTENPAERRAKEFALVEALSGSLCVTKIRRGEIRLIVARDGICRGGTASL